jgi:hypothetical protein
VSDRRESSAWELRLREATDALWPSHLRQPPSWIAFMREMDADWRRYMREHDSPEQRLRDKNPEPFRL